MPEWTSEDLALEDEKSDLVSKNRSKMVSIIVESILDFLGINFIVDFIKKEHRDWWDRFIALLITGAYVTALVNFLEFLSVLIETGSFATALGAESLKALGKKLAKSWLVWLLVLDIVIVVIGAVKKFINSEKDFRDGLWHIYLKHYLAPNRDAVFESNLGFVPSEPTAD